MMSRPIFHISSVKKALNKANEMLKAPFVAIDNAFLKEDEVIVSKTYRNYYKTKTVSKKINSGA